jgi:DNA invertase Pin-like site-specific DNA recombinase
VVEQVLAGIVLAFCAALLLRMLLRERERRRVDAVWQRAAQGGRQLARRLWFWPSRRRRAAREAEEAIRRAQHGAERDGKVVHPDAFKRPRKPH